MTHDLPRSLISNPFFAALELRGVDALLISLLCIFRDGLSLSSFIIVKFPELISL